MINHNLTHIVCYIKHFSSSKDYNSRLSPLHDVDNIDKYVDLFSSI